MISIIGGSIASLALAKKLSKMSLEFKIFEREPSFLQDQNEIFLLNRNILENSDFKREARLSLVKKYNSIEIYSENAVKRVIDDNSFASYDLSNFRYYLYKKIASKSKDSFIFNALFLDYNKNNAFLEESSKGTLRKIPYLLVSDGIMSISRKKLFSYDIKRNRQIYGFVNGSFDEKKLYVYLRKSAFPTIIMPISSKEAFIRSSFNEVKLQDFLEKNYLSAKNLKSDEYICDFEKKVFSKENVLLFGTAMPSFANAYYPFFESLVSADVTYNLLIKAMKGKNLDFKRYVYLFNDLFKHMGKEYSYYKYYKNLSSSKIDKKLNKLKFKPKQYITTSIFKSFKPFFIF